MHSQTERGGETERYITLPILKVLKTVYLVQVHKMLHRQQAMVTLSAH